MSERSYLNMFHINNEVHVPVFAATTEFENEAMGIIERETGKDVIKHDSEWLAELGGEIHCITKELLPNLIN